MLRPAVVLREDAWAYAPEHAAQLQRAREDVRAGRTIAVSGEELQYIVGLPDEKMNAELERLRQGVASGSGRA